MLPSAHVEDEIVRRAVLMLALVAILGVDLVNDAMGRPCVSDVRGGNAVLCGCVTHYAPAGTPAPDLPAPTAWHTASSSQVAVDALAPDIFHPPTPLA